MDQYINTDMDVQLPQYAVSREKEILELSRKSYPVEQADNEKDKKLVLTELPIMQRTYIESTSDLNWDTYIWPSLEQISLLGTSSDYIVKVMKPMYDVPEVNTTSYVTYHPH